MAAGVRALIRLRTQFRRQDELRPFAQYAEADLRIKEAKESRAYAAR